MPPEFLPQPPCLSGVAEEVKGDSGGIFKCLPVLSLATMEVKGDWEAFQLGGAAGEGKTDGAGMFKCLPFPVFPFVAPASEQGEAKQSVEMAATHFGLPISC